MALKTGPDYTNLPEKAMKLKLHLNAAKVRRNWGPEG